MKLTASQQKEYNHILNCINDAVQGKPYAPRIVSLEGQAGSGKTTLTAKIINTIMGKYTIKVTATTHKALKVLRDSLKLPENIQTSTIHSHLALKMKTNYVTGDMELIQDFQKTVQRVDVLFCDESSMASDVLFKHAENCVERRQAKIIVFVGDKYQLSPIDGNGTCPVFDIHYRYQLTEVVRQAADNPIIQLATEIRNDIESQNFRSYKEVIQLFKDYECSNIIIPKDTNELFTRFFEDIENKEKFICTYTNKAMKHYNNFCRNIVKKNPVDDYIVGDEIVFLEHHVVDDEIVHSNNEIVTIAACELKEYIVPGIWYWECRDNKGSSFNTIASRSANAWNKYLNDLAYTAKKLPKNERRNAWMNFYSNKEFMSPVAFTYAGTVHKSQGSTYDEIYVDVREILSAGRYQDPDMIFRLLYVAITRAKDKVILKLNM